MVLVVGAINIGGPHRSSEVVTMGELKTPKLNSAALAGNIPLGHVPGLTYSLRAVHHLNIYIKYSALFLINFFPSFIANNEQTPSNDCLYDINYHSLVSLKDGINVVKY